MALDSESDNFHHYYEKVCLLQVADGEGRVWFVDPLALPDLSALKPVMASPGREKVLHAAENDIASLKRDFKFEFASVFDTQMAARFCGHAETGLAGLLESELGIRHHKSKNLQRSDWSRRPLPRVVELYAAGDVRHLPALRDRMRDKLRALGRESWLREECEEMAGLSEAPPREPADFSRAGRALKLPLLALSILRELFQLREAWAREADLPPFKVVGEEALLAMAVQRPRDRASLGRIRGLSAQMRGRLADDLLAAIRRGESHPADPLPRRAPPARGRVVSGAPRRAGRLKEWRLRAAAQAGLDPGVLLPQRLIGRIANDAPSTLGALAAIPGIRRWRVESFGSGILRAAHP